MTDLWILVLGIGFFAVCALYVVFCDRIIGRDEDDSDEADDAVEQESVAAVGR
jgi:hypothetical protein